VWIAEHALGRCDGSASRCRTSSAVGLNVSTRGPVAPRTIGLHGRQPGELVLDLERFVRKSQIAGAENSIPGHIDANVGLRVDAGEYAETSLIQPRHELGLNGIRTPPRATLRLYTPPLPPSCPPEAFPVVAWQHQAVGTV